MLVWSMQSAVLTLHHICTCVGLGQSFLYNRSIYNCKSSLKLNFVYMSVFCLQVSLKHFHKLVVGLLNWPRSPPYRSSSRARSSGLTHMTSLSPSCSPSSDCLPTCRSVHSTNLLNIEKDLLGLLKGKKWLIPFKLTLFWSIKGHPWTERMLYCIRSYV